MRSSITPEPGHAKTLRHRVHNVFAISTGARARRVCGCAPSAYRSFYHRCTAPAIHTITQPERSHETGDRIKADAKSLGRGPRHLLSTLM